MRELADDSADTRLLLKAVLSGSSTLVVSEGVWVSERPSVFHLQNAAAIRGASIETGLDAPCAARSRAVSMDSMNHSSMDLLQAVLDAAFAGGAHLAYTDGAFRRFTGTHWAPLSDAELGGVVLHRLSLEASTNRVGQRSRTIIREVIELLKMHRATGADRSRLDEPRPVINVANGELWRLPGFSAGGGSFAWAK